MGFIAGLISKNGTDVSHKLLHMIKSSSNIEADFYGFASPNEVEIHYSSPDFLSIISEKMLAYKGLLTSPNSSTQPIIQKSGAMVYEGQLFNCKSPQQLLIAEKIRRIPEEGLKKILKYESGAYSILVSTETGLLSVRDPVGTIPLYYADSPYIAGIASNKKMLWSIGLKPITLLPGNLISLNKNSMNVEKVKGIIKPRTRLEALDSELVKLDRILESSINDMITGTGFTFLGFSGGIDSALIAYYLKKLEVDFRLITVAVEGSTEVKIAERAAELLGLRANVTLFNPADVEKIIDKALLTVEDYNPMKISVAIPLLWAAEIAGKMGRGTFFSGNGSDELFGGYQKFVRGYLSKGDRVNDDIYEAVINSHSVNYERDRKIFMDNGLDLKLPFAHIDLIRYALALPVEIKLPKSLSGQRKIILRKLAERKGLPLKVVNRPKKAIQYSTGVNRVLRKISRSTGMTTEKFLRKRFESIYQAFMSDKGFQE